MYTDTTSVEYQTINTKFNNDITKILQHLNYQTSTVYNVVCTSGSIKATGQVDVAGVNDVDALLADMKTASETIDVDLTSLSSSTTVTGACDDNTFNTCDANAVCSEGASYPLVTCACNFGYTDTNLADPGKSCQDQCYPSDPETPYCLNDAVCVPTSGNKPDCQCSQWYLGGRCENLNAGLVAAVVIAVLAGVLLMVVIFVVWRIRTHRMAGSNDFLSSIASSEAKYSQPPGVEAKSYVPTSYEDV